MSLERRGPAAEVVPTDDQPLVRVFRQQGVPRGVTRRPHSRTVSAAAGDRLIAYAWEQPGEAERAQVIAELKRLLAAYLF